MKNHLHNETDEEYDENSNNEWSRALLKNENETDAENNEEPESNDRDDVAISDRDNEFLPLGGDSVRENVTRTRLGRISYLHNYVKYFPETVHF